MDPLTHYMLAYFPGKKIGLDELKIKALVFSAFLPDIDVFTVIFGIDFLRDFHGTITHSFPVAVLMSIIFGSIILVIHRKMVFHLCLIGVSMHLLLDISMTLMPQWRDEGLMLLYPISLERFALRNYVPHSTIFGFIVMGFLFIFSVFILYKYVDKGEYPWRIWIDERKIIQFIKGN